MVSTDGSGSTPNYPLIIGAVVVLLALFLICNIRQLKNIVSHVTDLIANVINTVITLFSSLVDALKSAAYYFVVIRMMLFPSFNKRTNNMVLRMTVLFLSITSYITTYNSMGDALNVTVALLLTFCIQSLIVVISIQIGGEYYPFGKRDNKQDKSNVPVTTKKKTNIRKILTLACLAACLVLSVWFSKSYIVNQIKANAVFSKNNYFSVLDEFSRFTRTVEQEADIVKSSAIPDLKKANEDLETMYGILVSRFSADIYNFEEIADEKAVWFGTYASGGDADGEQPSLKTQVEKQIAEMDRFILSVENPDQAEETAFSITSYLAAAEQVKQIYAEVTLAENSDDFFSAEQNVQTMASGYSSRRIAQWELEWRAAYRDGKESRLGFIDTSQLIEAVEKTESESGWIGYLFSRDKELKEWESKKDRIHSLYRMHTEALIYGMEDYIAAIPPDVSANLTGESSDMMWTVTQQKSNIGEVVSSPLVLTQAGRNSESVSGANGMSRGTMALIWMIACMIDGLIVVLCFLIGKETMKNKTETQRVLLRALLIPEQKKETRTDQSMLLVSVICAGLLLIPLAFIPWLTAGWLLLIGVVLAGVFDVILTETKFAQSHAWFEKFVSKYLDVEPDAAENVAVSFSDTFKSLLKDIAVTDDADLAIAPEAEGKVNIAGVEQASIIMKMLETNGLAAVKGDTAYFNQKFFSIMSEFAVGLHRELEPMVAELVRLTLLQIDEEEAEDKKDED